MTTDKILNPLVKIILQYRKRNNITGIYYIIYSYYASRSFAALCKINYAHPPVLIRPIHGQSSLPTSLKILI